MWEIKYTAQAVKDISKLQSANLAGKAKALVELVRSNPFQNPPPYEKLQGYPARYSRRINRQHRLVYDVDAALKRVKILRMWTHYE
jgi:Txe/YoeB family toxin of toxin-antitoxin system